MRESVADLMASLYEAGMTAEVLGDAGTRKACWMRVALGSYASSERTSPGRIARPAASADVHRSGCRDTSSHQAFGGKRHATAQM